MEKEKIEIVESKKIELNLLMVDFVSKVIKDKLENLDSKSLGKLYKEVVGLKVGNINRVMSRVLRNDIREILSNEVNKRGLKIDDFLKVCNKIDNKMRENKNSNYLSIEVKK